MAEHEQQKGSAAYTPWPPGPDPRPPDPTGIPEIDRYWDLEFLRFLVNEYRNSPLYQLGKKLERWVPKTTPPPCEWVRVCINKMVAQIGVSTAGALMWRDHWEFTVTINGIPHTWNLAGVFPDTEHELGWCRTIKLSSNTAITVTAGGTNIWEGWEDIQLPAAVNTHDARDNWGVNLTHTLISADDFYDYEVEYTITCLLSATVSMISGTRLVERMLPVAIRKSPGNQMDDSTLLSISLRNLEQYGLRLKQMNGDTLVLEGPQSVQQLMDEIRPKGSPKISKNRKRS